MPALDPGLKAQAALELARVAGKPTAERGGSFGIIPRKVAGLVAGYRVEVVTDTGFSFTFAEVTATELPPATEIAENIFEEVLSELRRGRKEKSPTPNRGLGANVRNK